MITMNMMIEGISATEITLEKVSGQRKIPEMTTTITIPMM
jgi:hypothetical protein